MNIGQNAEVSEVLRAATCPSRRATKRCRRLSWMLAREAVRETIETRMHFRASAQAIWDALMFYEEVPRDAPLLFRALLPQPVRTEGDKRRAGTMVRCVYSGGAELVKRITRVEPPHLLRFEVVWQDLGIEDCVLALGGSYQIHSCSDSAEAALTTHYAAHLHPRWLWRRLEALLVTQLHRHIMRGICAVLLAGNPAMPCNLLESRIPDCRSTGGLACTVSQSSFRH